MVNEKAQQNVAVAEVTVLRAECDPSLKVSFMNRLAASGFRTQTDTILTLARDFVAGRIQYRDGILQSQQKNPPESPPDMPMGCPDLQSDPSASGGLDNKTSFSNQSQQINQSVPARGRQGVSHAHREANIKFKNE